jgi:hypothetical protein
MCFRLTEKTIMLNWVSGSTFNKKIKPKKRPFQKRNGLLICC